MEARSLVNLQASAGTGPLTAPLTEVGDAIKDLVAQKLHGGLAARTNDLYEQCWQRWEAWCARRGRHSPLLTGHDLAARLSNETELI